MYRTDLIYRYPKLLVVVNVLIALSFLVITLFFARDILSASLRKTEKAVSPASPSAQKMKKGLHDYAGIFKNNPFGFPGGQLSELSVAKEGGLSHNDLTLIGTVAGLSAHS